MGSKSSPIRKPSRQAAIVVGIQEVFREVEFSRVLLSIISQLIRSRWAEAGWRVPGRLPEQGEMNYWWRDR